MATRKIDHLPLTGRKVSTDQALQFPRIYPPVGTFPFIRKNQVYEGQYSGWYEDSDIPQEVKDAVCEEAAAILKYQGGMRYDLQLQGVTDAKIGDAEETYSGRKQIFLSPEAANLMQKYLLTAFDIA